MAVKIRLQRKGRKQQPYYYIVVTDSRKARGGQFIERLGSYNPMTDPASIDLNADRALVWLNNGAQPSETARRILSYKGVMFQKFLQRGVALGALTQEVADEKLSTWLQGKEKQIQDKVNSLEGAGRKKRQDALDKEKAVNQTRMDALKAKRDELAASAAAAAKAAEPQEESSADSAEVSAAESTEATQE